MRVPKGAFGLILAAVAAGATLAIPTPSLAASFSCGDGTVFVTLGPRDSLRLVRDGTGVKASWTSEGLLGGGGEGACPMANVDRVAVVSDPCSLALVDCFVLGVIDPLPVRSVTIDLGGGPIGPGKTREPKGISEIEIEIALGSETPTRDDVVIAGSPGTDVVRLGSKGFNLNGDDDVDLTVSGAETVSILGRAGNDRLRADGGAGTGAAWVGAVTIDGGAGSDIIAGGRAEDQLLGGDGNDSIFARDGKADTVSGGAGFDTAQVDRGRDRVSKIERYL